MAYFAPTPIRRIAILFYATQSQVQKIMNQDDAFDLLKSGKNIFLTGAAGSGKTYLLNKYISYLQEHNVSIAITASTGIAATHLQGTTIHSWSGIGVRENLTNKDLEKLLATPRIKRNYKNTKVLIIDEISMLHPQQLNMIDIIARFILDNSDPFGGMQVVLCGDFFQLPPVSSAPSTSVKQFAYEAHIWEGADFNVCYLSEQHRQGNDPLLTILNDIRSGTAGEHTKIPLRTRYKKEPLGGTKATRLYSRNINVDAINEEELGKISGQAKSYAMQTSGWDALVDGLKKTCLAQENLKLKLGAEVMFVKNDSNGEYVNGTRGVVVDFDDENWPVVRTYDHRIVIGYPVDWEYEDNGVVRATITQIPLRLAWAITIHKSQGMTLDAAEMDLGDAFEPGMGYVALSRVRSLNGLKLMNLNEMALKVHPKILQQDLVFKENSTKALEYLKNFSAAAKEEMHNQTLIMRFAGSANKEKNSSAAPQKNKVKKESAIPTHMRTLEMLKENLAISAIAQARGYTFDTILGHVEKLKGLKIIDNAQISYLKSAMPMSEFAAILEELKQSEDGKLSPVYEKFEGRFSYENIKLVRLFVW